MKTLHTVIAVALYFCTLLIATSPASATAQPTVLRIGYIPIISQLPLLLSYYHDQFKYVMVQPTIAQYNSFTALEAALRVNAIDVAIVPIPIALSMAADDIPIKLLGHISRGGSLLISKKPGDYGQLRDKVIGVPGLDSNENIFLRQALAKKRLRYGLDYKTIGIPMNSALVDLASGMVDALYYPEPYGTIALHNNSGYAILDQKEDLSGKTLYALVIRNSLLDQRHNEGLIEWMQSIQLTCESLEQQGLTDKVEDTPVLDFDEEIIEFSLKEKIGGLQFGLFLFNENELRMIMDKTIQLKILYKSIALENLVSPDLFATLLHKEESK